jgi:FMN reductase
MEAEGIMAGRTFIVGMGGSLAVPSNSLAALKLAVAGAQEAGSEAALLDIRSLELPFYSPDVTEPPRGVRDLVEAVRRADGLIWSSPMYHGTISGAFKNAIDWLQLLANDTPPYLTDKIVGLVSTAGGTQGLQAVNTMEFIVRSLRGWAVPLVIPIPQAWQAFDAAGCVRDAGVETQLHALGAEVARAATIVREARESRGEGLTTPEGSRVEAAVEGN